MIMTWMHDEPKRVVVKEDGISATFHFVKGISYNISDSKAEKVLRRKLSDAIATGKLEIRKGSLKRKEPKILDTGNEGN